MVAKPAQKSRIYALVDELVIVIGGEWATTIDQPFAITSCIERMVIFNLRFRIEVGDKDSVVIRDNIIGQHLRWNGVCYVNVL